MYKNLRKRAKRKVEAKKAFYTCAIVFFFVTITLIMLSYILPGISKWLMLPIPVFAMVLAILYLSAFGNNYVDVFSKDAHEEEIEKEMLKMYRQEKRKLPPVEDLSETEILELKELEKLKEKWNSDEDFV